MKRTRGGNRSTTRKVTQPAAQAIVSQRDHAWTCNIAGLLSKRKLKMRSGAIRIPAPMEPIMIVRTGLESFMKNLQRRRPRRAWMSSRICLVLCASSSASQSNSSEESVPESESEGSNEGFTISSHCLGESARSPVSFL